MTVRKRVWVEGRVQGVCFRDSCARQAASAGLRGFVKNLADGRVEAVFEGAAVDVARLVDWCRRGPAAAQVRSIEITDEPPTGEAPFRVAW